MDWAAADYKPDERLGVRFGKVKTPSGLFNDIQDIDPSYIWSLLPQSIYPINSRNSILAHYGGVAYGTFKLGAKAGKLEYRGWGGERQIGSGDGYLLAQAEVGAAATEWPWWGDLWRSRSLEKSVVGIDDWRIRRQRP